MTTRNQLMRGILEHMGQLRRRMEPQKQAYLQQFNLTKPQSEILYLLSKGETTVKLLSELTANSSSATTQIIEGLEKNGLVVRSHGTVDRRTVLVKLSPKGTTLFKKFSTLYLACMGELFQSLSEHELQSLHAILEKVTAHNK